MKVRPREWTGSLGLQWSSPLGVWPVPPPLVKGLKLVLGKAVARRLISATFTE